MSILSNNDEYMKADRMSDYAFSKFLSEKYCLKQFLLEWTIVCNGLDFSNSTQQIFQCVCFVLQKILGNSHLSGQFLSHSKVSQLKRFNFV